MCNVLCRYGIGFSGDTQSTWDTLALQVAMTPTAANVLFGYWSHDIGGEQGRKGLRWMERGGCVWVVHAARQLSSAVGFVRVVSLSCHPSASLYVSFSPPPSLFVSLCLRHCLCLRRCLAMWMDGVPHTPPTLHTQATTSTAPRTGKSRPASARRWSSRAT
jgi:hypothetical protein